MFSLTVKRFSLPFWNPKQNESDVEAAAVFAVAELERSKGSGFLKKQPTERLAYLAKVAYPLWLFPRNGAVYVFDALDGADYKLGYLETPPAKAFEESLEASSQPRENYMAFLVDHANYFANPKEKVLTLHGLLAAPEFLEEFNVYRKEASEIAVPANVGWLLPILDEPTVTATLNDLETLREYLREDTQRLPECARSINKTTAQYLSELDYEAAAAVEEIDAKIRAQEELTNPQIAKLNKDYKRKIDDLTDSFDQELDRLAKQKTKTENAIRDTEAEISAYEREAKAHSKKGHAGYEKHWKEKAKITNKELGNLKKAHKKLDDAVKKVSAQKSKSIAKLYAELDEEVKLARQPLLQLEINREAKTRTFKEQTQRLLALEKPVLEGLSQTIKLRGAVNANFEALTLKDAQLKTTSLIYVSFYVACYEAGLNRRYLTMPPATLANVNFSSKLKNALGMSKTKNMLTPRFSTLAEIIRKVDNHVKQNSAFETQLFTLSQKNNLLDNRAFFENASRGLDYLLYQGWLSEREKEYLGNRLVS
ncbi:MAG: hypothetical protein NWE92_06340 [Candidatus Bathyarchaeota archaeon]|nr:hypothetical protein [Candidatus Bathyarchaeota archaeon]